MTALRAYLPFESPSGSGTARKVLSRAALPLLVAGAVFATCALAGVPGGWLVAADDAAGSPSPVAMQETQAIEPDPVEAAGDKKARARCASCSTVVAIRRIEAEGGQPEAFDFTVRLPDGTLRTRRTDTAGNWRTGERIILLGGTATVAGSPL
jgi:hypothetical protein